MALTKAIHIDIPLYRNNKLPQQAWDEAKRRAKEAYNNAGINADEYIIEQRIFIRNTIIRKK